MNYILVDEPYFSKIKKYSFQGARPSYGATVAACCSKGTMKM